MLCAIGPHVVKAAMNDYCSIPPFVSISVPPNVMIMLSIETPMQGAMYPDITCTGDPATDDPPYGCSPSSCRTTSSGRHISRNRSPNYCYNNSTEYIGYFNPLKCYTYDGDKFVVAGDATNHQCSSQWSGNLLNWATMTAMDGFRRSLTGGNRSTDTSSDTILLGARQTLGTGDSWYPMKQIPYESASLYSPYANNSTRYIVRQVNGFSVCSNSNCTVKETGSGETRFPTTSGATNVTAAFKLQVQVCSTASGLETNCNTSNNKPEGLLQRYASRMRFALMSYAMTGNANINRDGGVLRSNMKWIANKIPYGLKYHDSGGSIVTCTTEAGCTNPEAELNANGTFISNPDGITGGNSGIINYINKFGYNSGYKSYDPISEMYYEIIRYFKNLGPSTDIYCNGLTTTTDDGFTYFCPGSGRSWRDPYLYRCQAGVVLGINDANPWCDKRVPGTSYTSSPGGSCGNDFGAPSNADTTINSSTWTNKLGNYEFGSTITLNVGCVVGGTCDWANTAKTFTDLAKASGTAPYAPKSNSYYISGLAYYAHTTDVRSDLEGKQTITFYVIDTQESNTSMLVGKKSMLFLAAKYGGFNDVNGPNADGYYVPDIQSEWDSDNDGFPDNYLLASSDPSQIETGFAKFFQDILTKSSSGTAASVLASSEGSGANLLQAIFYPKRLIGTSEVTWIGEMQNLWYYIDPYLSNSQIREDTEANTILHLIHDYIIQFYVDSVANKTKVRRYSDTDGDGTPDGTAIDSIDIDNIANIWEAGKLLWQRDLSATPRTIYTTTDGSSFLSGDFSTSNASTLRTYMDAADDAEATKIINYVHGYDQTGYRSRSVTISGTTNIWKLGDIVSSTPRIQASVPINSYHMPPPDGYQDYSYLQYIQTSGYRAHGMAYAGANDGMLHAFKLGQLEQTWTGQAALEVAKLSGSDLGKELWSFIPKNALPYLKYLGNPDYCHIYFIDNPAYLVDASVYGGSGTTQSPTYSKSVNSWKSLLIGGMGVGGACRNAGTACNSSTTDCVNTPINNTGYSSYFALDVTDPTTPTLLWEFSNPELGFTTTGPAIVRVGDMDKNGRWFAVFSSGPTGPIDTTWHQFLARSDQNLRIFIVDLYNGQLLRTIDTSIPYAFGGSLYNSTLDADRGGGIAASGRYSDDAVYLGYVKKDTTAGTWTKGGVLRILTNHDTDPTNWTISTVIDDIGPVTSAIAKLQDRKRNNLWLYFGSGRFYYRTNWGSNIDDADGQRALYGIREPCYTTYNTIDGTCSDSVTLANLTDQTSSPQAALASGSRGWYITLDASSTDYKAERIITDPLAVFSGIVFFTSFAPSSDPCALGGNTYIWALNYATGAQGAASALSGKAIFQVSTGEIKELSLGSIFTEKGSRRTTGIQGVPPRGQGLSVLIGPRPMRRILHIQEK